MRWFFQRDAFFRSLVQTRPGRAAIGGLGRAIRRMQTLIDQSVKIAERYNMLQRNYLPVQLQLFIVTKQRS